VKPGGTELTEERKQQAEEEILLLDGTALATKLLEFYCRGRRKAAKKQFVVIS